MRLIYSVIVFSNALVAKKEKAAMFPIGSPELSTFCHTLQLLVCGVSSGKPGERPTRLGFVELLLLTVVPAMLVGEGRTHKKESCPSSRLFCARGRAGCVWFPFPFFFPLPPGLALINYFIYSFKLVPCQCLNFTSNVSRHLPTYVYISVNQQIWSFFRRSTFRNCRSVSFGSRSATASQDLMSTPKR